MWDTQPLFPIAMREKAAQLDGLEKQAAYHLKSKCNASPSIFSSLFKFSHSGDPKEYGLGLNAGTSASVPRERPV